MGIQYWGYLHNSGTIHIKRYFDRLDIVEAKESSFVERVVGPFEVESRDEAVKIINEKLGVTK